MNLKTIKTSILTSLLFVSCHLFAQSPGGIEKQTLWLQGNFNQQFAQAGSLNFNPATTLDVNVKNMGIPHSIYELRQATIFTVYQDNTPGGDDPVWEMTGEFGDVQLSTQTVFSQSRKSKLIFVEKSMAPHAMEKPKAVINTYTRRAGNSGFAPFENEGKPVIHFGGSGYSELPASFSGLIAEFILYESILEDEEVTRLETYLALKYGITLEKDYLNSSSETVWYWENDSTFSNNIAGIARDDESTLYQKQGTSSSGTEQLVINIDKIAGSNSENTGAINDRDYLVWGDNAQDFIFERYTSPGSGEMTLLNKKWLMNPSGSTANTISTELKIDIQTLLHPSFPKKRFCLVIDRSGTGNFSSGTSEIIFPTSISQDGIAIFDQILWDTDNSGKDVFTFGLRPDLPLIHQPGNPIDSRSSQFGETVPGASAVTAFQVYPNPSLDGNYNLSISLSQPTDIKIQVFDMNQRLIVSKKGKGRAEYYLSGVIDDVPGVYTILLVMPGEEISRKIIVE